VSAIYLSAVHSAQWACLRCSFAVLGSGGFAAFVAHPARTGLAIASIVLSVAALFTEGNLSRGERDSQQSVDLRAAGAAWRVRRVPAGRYGAARRSLLLRD